MCDERLPATVFETYMMSDDTPSYPMTFQFLYVFRGVVDESGLQVAVDKISLKHPLTTAGIATRGGNWSWIQQHRKISIDFGPLEKPLICQQGVRIDLQSEPGVRIWCRTNGDRTELTLQVHHACIDGLGTLQFMFDVLIEYHSIVTELDERQSRALHREINPDLLSQRDKIDLSPPEPVGLIRMVQVSLTEATKLLLRQPQQLASRGLSPTPDSERPNVACGGAVDLPQLHWLSLSAETSAVYQEKARTLGVTTNDLFMRDMFVTLVRWAEHCGCPIPPRKWLRLTVPVSIRTSDQAKMSAANVISYSFLSRLAQTVDDPKSLLDDIHEESEAVKYWRLSGMFLLGVGALHRVRLLRPLLRMPRCFSTIVVSNLGDINRQSPASIPSNQGRLIAGNLELLSVAAAPPTRPKTHCAIVIARYAGQYTLALQTDRTLDASAAKEFLDLYAAQVTETANLPVA